jgi:hypothetical protein
MRILNIHHVISKGLFIRNLFRVRLPYLLFVDRQELKYYTINHDDPDVSPSSWWVGYFCYGLRPFQLHVTDCLGREVMRISRPFACTSRVLPCQLQKVEVFAPPGRRIGTVEQQWTAVRPVYLVKNSDDEDTFWIRGK